MPKHHHNTKRSRRSASAVGASAPKLKKIKIDALVSAGGTGSKVLVYSGDSDKSKDQMPYLKPKLVINVNEDKHAIAKLHEHAGMILGKGSFARPPILAKVRVSEASLKNDLFGVMKLLNDSETISIPEVTRAPYAFVIGAGFRQVSLPKQRARVNKSDPRATLLHTFRKSSRSWLLEDAVKHACEASHRTQIRARFVQRLFPADLTHNDRKRVLDELDRAFAPKVNESDAPLYYAATTVGDPHDESLEWDWRAPRSDWIRVELKEKVRSLAEMERIHVVVVIFQAARALSAWGRHDDAAWLTNEGPEAMSENERAWMSFIHATLNAYGGKDPSTRIKDFVGLIEKQVSTEVIPDTCIETMLDMWPIHWTPILARQLLDAGDGIPKNLVALVAHRASLAEELDKRITDAKKWRHLASPDHVRDPELKAQLAAHQPSDSPTFRQTT